MARPAAGFVAPGDRTDAGEISSSAGTAVTLGSTTQCRICGAAARAVSVIGVLLLPPVPAAAGREPSVRRHIMLNRHSATGAPMTDSIR
jgi:hypothetical protein